MNKFETDYPNICKIEEIGESVQGRKLLVAKVSDSVAEDEAEPGVFFISTIHGDETCGFVLMLHLIDSLLTGYTNSPRIKNLVDNIEIWIYPLSNPDGTYHDQGPQGVNANNKDLNRNFPSITGQIPPAEKETKAIIDFLSAHYMTLAVTFHGGAELALYPWACDSKDHTFKNWFEFVAKEYADTAQEYSPSGYFTNNGGYINHYQWYQVNGTLLDYATYFALCRTIRVELSSQKLLSESQLINHWNYNYRSFLNYIEQSLYGVRGTVTDSLLGWPLEAKVFLEYNPLDSSHVYSQLPHGDYYLPIHAGTHNITFSREQYYSKTIHNVVVNKNGAAILNAKLVEITNITSDHDNKNAHFTVSMGPSSRIIKISYILTNNGNTKLQIYNMKGILLTTLVDSYKQAGEYKVNWDSKIFGSGIYYIKLSAANNTLVKKTIIMK